MYRRERVADRIPWTWGSKIADQLLQDGLVSVRSVIRGTVLDLGCGSKPYQRPLGRDADRWIGMDRPDAAAGRPEADVFGSGLGLPFRSDVFDSVLCTQVLEHVPAPERLLAEVYRVLKPGGALVLTAPQTNPLHEEPRDYFRYTRYGLELLAEKAGLTVVEIRPLGGAIACVGQMVTWHLGCLRRLPLVGPLVLKGATALIAWIALRMDRVSFSYGGGALKDTLNWLLVARKPGIL